MVFLALVIMNTNKLKVNQFMCCGETGTNLRWVFETLKIDKYCFTAFEHGGISTCFKEPKALLNMSQDHAIKSGTIQSVC